MSTHLVDINQFGQLLASDIARSFVSGYEEYRDSNSNIKSDNEYWKHLRYLAKKPVITEYQSLSEDEIKKIILNRFALIEKTRHSFDIRYPVLLYQKKYSPLSLSVTTKKSEKLFYNALDGYHRIIISHYHGRTEIPVKEQKIQMEHSHASISEYMNQHDGWYQPIDFGYENNFDLFHFRNPDNNLHGVKKYKFALEKHLGDIKGKKIIELGCRTGAITSAIAQAEPELVVGIDKAPQIRNALYVLNILWKDYGNISFKVVDISNISDFRNLCNTVRPDCILASNIIYCLGDKIDDVIGVCSEFSRKIILQGNVLKRHNGKRVTRRDKNPLYRGEYSQVQPMRQLLTKHGYQTYVDSFQDAEKPYDKPVVVGIKS